MKLSERFEGICSYFEQNMSSAASELVFASPYQLLVAVMLSAQCQYDHPGALQEIPRSEGTLRG